MLPSALLPGDHRSWEAIDEDSARFTLVEGELEVSGVFRFDEFGNIVGFESEERPYTGEARPETSKWIVRYGEHRRFGAVELPTGFLAMLMTDIEGSTTLLDRLGDEYGELLSDVRELQRSAVSASDGTVVEARADEFFAVFESPREALEALYRLKDL